MQKWARQFALSSLIFSVCTVVTCVSVAQQLEPENRLTLHVISAPTEIKWDSVRGMLVSTVKNSLKSGDKGSYPIGHFAVEVKCASPNELGIHHFLTGMTRKNPAADNKFIKKSGIGLGTLIYPFEGTLENSSELASEFKTMEELGRYHKLDIPVTAQRCQQMMDFMKAWIDNASYTVYGGGNDTALGEGAGCADFAERFYEIATDQKFDPDWIVERKIPNKLIGGDGRNVSILKVLLRKKWAKKKEAYTDFRTPDPTMAFINLKTNFNINNVLQRVQETDSVSGIENDVTLFNFKYDSKEKPADIWQKIKI